MDILIKVSGDLARDGKFYTWLNYINNSSNKLFVLCGGGSEITKTLKKSKMGFHFGPVGREIRTSAGRVLAKGVLQKQQEIIERELAERKIKAFVLVPFITKGNNIFHLNGDKLAEALYPNFDKIIIVTIKGRIKNYAKALKKIEVVHL